MNTIKTIFKDTCKALIISCFIAIIGLIVCYTIIQIENNVSLTNNLYPLATKVVSVNQSTDVVSCQDYNGNIWEFYGCEDWEVDDIASLLMNNKGTKNIYDDTIVEIRYQGVFEKWQ